MNNDNFKWTDELVSECYREIRRRLDNPNEYEGTWEGISKEILKFKASNTSSKKDEKIRISHLEEHDSFKGNWADAFWYQFCSSKRLPKDLLHSLELSIEASLTPPTLAPTSTKEQVGWEIVEMYNEYDKIHKHTVNCDDDRFKCTIHSVRRKDGVVFSVGDEVVHKTDGMINTAKILKFSPSNDKSNKMYFEFMEGWTYVKDLANFNPLSKRTKPPSCNICGGELVHIRGRYPNSDKREVCPTCNTERLEQINEISSKTYGVAMQESEMKINPIP